ncbi:hypothetical protein RFI_40234 [Reticulomyxa filosa]|uniref:Uncharacterized protein n=1 Tax=Reticulomyxa filosa TaxID=46433 RepID=X6L8C9_RETFI|nr:hypothetical protein RFI_40234 [Reticulomyxa filosa]|eukprot:ETN97296.1 hypothetical protein RFI_40234 [Reticulomyxa filosa]
MEETSPSSQQQQKRSTYIALLYLCVFQYNVPKTVYTCSSTLRDTHNKLRHLKTYHHPTLQDTRPVNGSNDKMSLCDIKKAIEDNERETEEVNEDEDEDSKAEHDAQKAWYWHPNTNCGTVREKTYFKVKKKEVLDYCWVCFDVGKQTDGNNDNDHDDKDETTPSSQAQLPKIKFKIGDYAKLSRGKAGVVKYIGEHRLHFSNNNSFGEAVGSENLKYNLAIETI